MTGNMDIVLGHAHIAQSRSNLYNLFAALYLKEVTPELLAALRTPEFIDSLDSIAGHFQSVLTQHSEAKLLDELAEEYAALFVLPGGASPYESVWLKGMLCQEPASLVDAFYKKYGLNVKEDLKVFPDHAGLEFQFMGSLADMEQKAWQTGSETAAFEYYDIQKTFFIEHLDKWIFRFLDTAERYSMHPFYKGASRLAQSYLHLEKEDFTMA